ncbi:MAG: SDR family oxidoreductase [Patescibacteria group bacterium]|jgi:putative NADH-flavin reductase|nr:SDR family oxidoreductase [Patescibacteria group bacterium]
MHKIIIFGASGRTGILLVNQALKQGHLVTAFTHTPPPEGTLPNHQNLSVISADASQEMAVLQAIQGHNVIINVIAPKLFDTNNHFISETATKNIINSMYKTGAKRYIGQSGAWATEHLEDASQPMKIAFNLMPQFKSIYKYKKLEDQIIKSSGLNYTIVRCGRLTDDQPISNYRVFMDRYKCKSFEIPKIRRINVADFELNIIDKAEFVGKCPIIIE